MTESAAIELFPVTLAREIDAYLEEKALFTNEKRTEDRYWLLNTDRKVQGKEPEVQQQQNIWQDVLPETRF